ncbi:MAG: alpha/beta hydrolase [Clostridia bacterium]|nr:alpha/beta hydrolase [Clostridia bacterium]
MEYMVEDVSYLSSNQINYIKGKIYIPKTDNIKGIIQVVHGMSEYFGRYIKFVEYMIDQGYIVCGHDHLGHGTTVTNPEDYGYFANKYGYNCLIRDTYFLTKIVKEKYPNLKYTILGHSMGSFITRCYMYTYGNDVDNVIISGTMGPIKVIDAGILLTEGIIKRKGERYRSKKIMKLAFKALNIKIKFSRTQYDWVSRDIYIDKAYSNDKFGNIIFTASGFRDLFKLVKFANYKMSIQRMRKDLPIFIISGDKDPIGNYGKGVTKVYEVLKEAGCNAKIKLYKNGRHEMLNEINADRVYKDILSWIEEVNKIKEK